MPNGLIAQRVDSLYKVGRTLGLPVKIINTKGDSIFFNTYFAKDEKQILGISKTEVEKIVYKNKSTEFFSKRALDSLETLKRQREELAETVKTVSQRKKYERDSLSKIREQNSRAADSAFIVLSKHKTQAIKIAPAFPFGYFTLGYEKRVKKGQSIETRLGLIGIGSFKDENFNQSGVYGTIGYKFNFTLGEQKRLRHPLHGAYFRTDLSAGYYSLKYKNSVYTTNSSLPEIRMDNHDISYQCLLFSIGAQIVERNMTFDFFANMGIGAYKQSEESFGIVEILKYGNSMTMDKVSGVTNTRFRIGFYIGHIF